MGLVVRPGNDWHGLRVLAMARHSLSWRRLPVTGWEPVIVRQQRNSRRGSASGDFFYDAFWQHLLRDVEYDWT